MKSWCDRLMLIPYRIILALFFALMWDVSVAQVEPEANWDKVCQVARTAALAIAPPAGTLSGNQLSNCDESTLYYGMGQKPDYAAALQCGLHHLADYHAHGGGGDLFSGPGVLTMLYANGQGVRRDYDLAIRFACEMGDVEAGVTDKEMAFRIGLLEQMRTQEKPEKFDLCDSLLGPTGESSCATLEASVAAAKNSSKVEKLAQGLPAAANTALDKLKAAEDEFETVCSDKEVEQSGTGGPAFVEMERKALDDQFRSNLQRFGRGQIPAASKADLAQLERELNAIYRRIQNSPASKWEGTIQPEGIKETERKWIALADAWMAFGRIAYPKLSPEQIRAQLIRSRLDQLREIYKNQ